MSKENKTGSFFEEVIARIKGDNPETLAKKIERKAQCAVESQIAGLKAAINDKKDDVADKEEALHNAIYPCELFTQGRHYVESVSTAKAAVDCAKAELAEMEEQLKFWEETLKDKFKEE
jgi:multidrug resistance efflux pump